MGSMLNMEAPATLGWPFSLYPGLLMINYHVRRGVRDKHAAKALPASGEVQVRSLPLSGGEGA